MVIAENKPQHDVGNLCTPHYARERKTYHLHGEDAEKSGKIRAKTSASGRHSRAKNASFSVCLEFSGLTLISKSFGESQIWDVINGEGRIHPCVTGECRPKMGDFLRFCSCVTGEMLIINELQK